MDHRIERKMGASIFDMKNIILIAAALFSPVFLASCVTTGSGNNQATKPYPLDKCIVMDVPLGKMGKPKRLVYEGQEMKFCCTRCVKAFRKNPDAYIDKLAKEIAAASASEGNQVITGAVETTAPTG